MHYYARGYRAREIFGSDALQKQIFKQAMRVLRRVRLAIAAMQQVRSAERSDDLAPDERAARRIQARAGQTATRQAARGLRSGV